MDWTPSLPQYGGLIEYSEPHAEKSHTWNINLSNHTE
jgi:hypothetical protein